MTYNKDNMAEDKNNISWRAAEYNYFKKGPLWYLVLIIVVVISTGIALWQNNFFFAVFILLAGVMLGTLGKKRPKIIDFKITDDGIEIGSDIKYDYEDLEGFDVREFPDRLNEIIIRRDVKINAFVKMPIDSTLLPKAVEKLKEQIPEEEYEEPASDIFSDLIRF